MDLERAGGAATLWDLVELRRAATPDAPMLVDEHDAKLTFGGFAERAERVAAGLHVLGIGPRTKVSWQLPTRIDTIVVATALARLGAHQNPIIPIYRQREVAAVLRQHGTEWLLVPRSLRGFDHEAMARELAGTGPIQVLVTDDGLPEGDPATLPPPPTDGDEVRWLYSTSGTTSEPKGVLHTDRTLIAGGLGVAGKLATGPEDVGTIAFPFAHIGGPNWLVLMLATRTPSVILEAFVPGPAIEVFRRHGVTITGGSTAFYLAFLAEQRADPSKPVLASLRLLVGGGAPKPPELYWQVKHELGIPVAHGYGMTECPMIANGSAADTDEQLAHTDGAPVDGCEIAVRDASGEPVAAGTPGEIWVRGPMLCKGYTDPEATSAAFDDAGWFHTGDIGFVRPDGHVVLVGRSKDMIIRKGENVSPSEVEDVLQQHPAVAASAVIGLPDADRGERVCAVVELRHGATAPTLTDVVAHCRAAGLMAQKIPEQLEIVDALPRNATMKILKAELRAWFEA